MAKKIQKGFIQEALELGEKRGEKRGFIIGKKRGIVIGEEIGIRVGMRRRELRSCVELILAILEARFWRVPKRIENSLNKQIEVHVLKSLIVHAAMCSSLEEFVADL